MSFPAFQKALPPGYLQGPYGAAWAAAHGAAKDSALEHWKNAIKARYPDTAPLDALYSLAEDRGIYQGPAETLGHYIERLKNAWGAWTIAASAWGLLAQLGGMGYGTAYVLYANGFVFGPSSGVTAPDPINGLPGAPPVVARPQVYYTSGGGSAVWAPNQQYGLGFLMPYASGQVGGWWQCVQAGISGATAPLWNFAGTADIVDGTVKWRWYGYFATATDLPPLVRQLPFVLGSGNGQAAWSPVGAGGAILPGYVNSGPPSTPYGPSAMLTPYPLGWNVSPESWTERNWNRFVVVIDQPLPTSWTLPQNPPTSSTRPSAEEIALIAKVIHRWKSGYSHCVGLLVPKIEGDPRSAWGWPLLPSGLTTPDGESLPPCWLSRMGVSGVNIPNGTTVRYWAPQMALPYPTLVQPSPGAAVANAPSVFYISSPTGTVTGLVEPAWSDIPGSQFNDNGNVWTYGGALGQWVESAYPLPQCLVFALES